VTRPLQKNSINVIDIPFFLKIPLQEKSHLVTQFQ